MLHNVFMQACLIVYIIFCAMSGKMIIKSQKVESKKDLNQKRLKLKQIIETAYDRNYKWTKSDMIKITYSCNLHRLGKLDFFLIRILGNYIIFSLLYFSFRFNHIPFFWLSIICPLTILHKHDDCAVARILTEMTAAI